MGRVQAEYIQRLETALVEIYGRLPQMEKYRLSSDTILTVSDVREARDE